MGRSSKTFLTPLSIPVPPKGREIQRTPLREKNDTSYIIPPPEAFKTPSCDSSVITLPRGRQLPRTPEGENSDYLVIPSNEPIKGRELIPRTPDMFSTGSSISRTPEILELSRGCQLPRTPEGENSDYFVIPSTEPIKGRELIRTPDANYLETNYVSTNRRDAFDMVHGKRELPRTPVNGNSEIHLVGKEIDRTPINDSIQTNDESYNRRTTFDMPVKGKDLVSESGEEFITPTNLAPENIIPKGRQLSRTPQNCNINKDTNIQSSSIDEVRRTDELQLTSEIHNHRDTEVPSQPLNCNKQETFRIETESLSPTDDVFEPPSQFCDNKKDLISPPADFVQSKSITSSTEADRRGSYVLQKCFTDRRGTFTVDASLDDSIYTSLDKNYVGPIPKRKELQQLPEGSTNIKHQLNNKSIQELHPNSTEIPDLNEFDLPFTKEANNTPKENMTDETVIINKTLNDTRGTFTINETRERLNTNELSFFDPLAETTINTGRPSIVIKSFDDKPLAPIYTPEMAQLETQPKRNAGNKNYIPQGRKQLPRTPTGIDDLIDLKNESTENGCSSFAIGDLTVEIFVKDKKRESLQVVQKSTSDSRGSIGALVKEMDSNVESNTSALSTTPQKCASALNMETPVCAEIRNQDRKTGKITKMIIQKNAKNLLQNNMDTIDDEDEEPLEIFCKKESSSNFKDQKANTNKISYHEKMTVTEEQSSEQIKIIAKSNKLENKEITKEDKEKKIKENYSEIMLNDKTKFADKESRQQDSSEIRTENQKENLQHKEIIDKENHIETNKNINKEETMKKTKIIDEHNKNKSVGKNVLNEKENLAKTINDNVEDENKKKDEQICYCNNKEVKNNVNKNEKELIIKEKTGEINGELDLKNYIDLHKKSEIKNFKIPKLNKQEKVEDKKRLGENKSDDEAKQTIACKSEKQSRDNKSKLQISKGVELDRKSKKSESEPKSENVEKSAKSVHKEKPKSNESESQPKIVEKSADKEKPKSALGMLLNDLNVSSDFDDSFEIFPLKRNKIPKTIKKPEISEVEINKLVNDKKEKPKKVKDMSQRELENEHKTQQNNEDDDKYSSTEKYQAKKDSRSKKIKSENKTKKNTPVEDGDELEKNKLE
ncbi:unnamed protein product, partial [Meganyctiphanes norvegica]